MEKEIRIKDCVFSKLVEACKNKKINIMTALKGAVLIIANMWFLDEKNKYYFDDWETFFYNVENSYIDRNFIEREEVIFQFNESDKNSIKIIMSDDKEELINDMILSIYEVINFYIKGDFKGEIKDFLPEYQKHLIEKVNDTKVKFNIKCLHEKIFDYSSINPNKVALETLYEEGIWKQVTYSSLKIRSLKVSNLLKDSGVGKGDRVAIVLPKGEEQIIGVLGILAIGAVYVPVGIKQPIERKKKIFKSGNVKYILTNGINEDMLQNIEDIELINIEKSMQCKEMNSTQIVKDPELLAYIIFTSGTTGVPKGVMIKHKAASNTIEDICAKFNVSERDCSIGVSELDFDLSVFDIFGILGVGGRLIVLNEENKREPTIWKKILFNKKVTIWNTVPAIYEMLLLILTDSEIKDLRLVMLSGDWIKSSLFYMTKRIFPKSKFVSLGGATEASIWSVFYHVVDIDDSWASIPYGKPLSNQMLRIVNSTGQSCPFGVQGELLIGGDGVAEGYASDPELSSKKFIEIDGIHWYKTGDKAQYYKDGNIEFLGRMDDQVKVNGYRIELGEIESTIKQSGDINDAVAVVSDLNTKKEIVAAVVPKIERNNIKVNIKIHEKSEQYLNEKNCRKRTITRIILDINGMDTTKLGLGDEIYIETNKLFPEFWKEWLINENQLKEICINKYEIIEDFSDLIDFELYNALKNKIPTLKKVMNREVPLITLLEDIDFSPEKLLIQGSDTDRFINEIINVLSQNEGGKVGILNCKTGLAIETILQKNFLDIDTEITLIDSSMTMLTKAKTRFKDLDADINYYFMEENCIELQYLGYFDLVIMIGTLHQYNNPQNGIDTAIQLLSENGTLFALEYEDLDPMAIISSAIIEKGFINYSRKRRNTSLLTTEEWEHILKTSGFDDASIEVYPTSSAQFIKATTSNEIVKFNKKTFREYLKEHLTDYMLPNDILCFIDFPLTYNGKIDRKKICSIIQKKSKDVLKDTNFTAFESEILNIWKEILFVDFIGRTDSFFRVGGDSLSATKLIEKVRRSYDITLSLKEIFDNPELDKFAEIVQRKMAENEELIEGEI